MNAKQLEIVTKTAVQTALEYLEKEKQKQQKAKRDRRLRNTKLLLKHYRSFKLHCEDVKIELEKIKEADLLNDLDSDELAIEAIRKSKERTLAMVRFIDRMLEVYRILCETSEKPEEMRRYKTLYMMYLAEEKYSADEIAKRHFIDRRTVFKDIEKACETLSALIFGVDGVRMRD